MPMLAPTRVLNRYDHRLRDLVHATADPTIARKNGVPRSTAAGWINAVNRCQALAVQALAVPCASSHPIHLLHHS